MVTKVKIINATGFLRKNQGVCMCGVPESNGKPEIRQMSSKSLNYQKLIFAHYNTLKEVVHQTVYECPLKICNYTYWVRIVMVCCDGYQLILYPLRRNRYCPDQQPTVSSSTIRWNWKLLQSKISVLSSPKFYLTPIYFCKQSVYIQQCWKNWISNKNNLVNCLSVRKAT